MLPYDRGEVYSCRTIKKEGALMSRRRIVLIAVTALLVILAISGVGSMLTGIPKFLFFLCLFVSFGTFIYDMMKRVPQPPVQKPPSPPTQRRRT